MDLRIRYAIMAHILSEYARAFEISQEQAETGDAAQPVSEGQEENGGAPTEGKSVDSPWPAVNICVLS